MIWAAVRDGCWKNSAAAERHAPIPSTLPSGGTARRNCELVAATWARDFQFNPERMFCGEPVEAAQMNVSWATTVPVGSNGMPPAAVRAQSDSAIQISGRPVIAVRRVLASAPRMTVRLTVTSGLSLENSTAESRIHSSSAGGAATIRVTGRPACGFK